MFYDLYCNLCQAKNEKPSRVADNLGINRSTVSQWKAKYKQGIDITPNSEVLKKISEYFGVSIDYLLGIPSTAHLDKIEDTHGKDAADWVAAGKSLSEWAELHPEKENAPALNKRDERDIAKKLNDMVGQLGSSGEALMFDGEPLDEETRELLFISLKNQLEMTKKLAKQKYTPKKYRK